MYEWFFSLKSSGATKQIQSHHQCVGKTIPTKDCEKCPNTLVISQWNCSQTRFRTWDPRLGLANLLAKFDLHLLCEHRLSPISSELYHWYCWWTGSEDKPVCPGLCHESEITVPKRSQRSQTCSSWGYWLQFPLMLFQGGWIGLWLRTHAIVSGCWEFRSQLYILLAVWTLGKLLPSLSQIPHL